MSIALASAGRALTAVLLLSTSVASAGPPGRVVRVGLLYSISPNFDPAANPFDRELVDGLRELGYTPGREVVFELRSAAGGATRLPQLAAELVAAKVDMLVTPGTQAALDASKVTKTVPIVMVGTADPVENGLVASLARPGGNVTGLAVNAVEIAAKRVQLLGEAVPKLSRVAVLWNSSIQSMTLGYQMIEQAAPSLGVTIQSVRVSGSDQFDQAPRPSSAVVPAGSSSCSDRCAGTTSPASWSSSRSTASRRSSRSARACAAGD